MRTQRQGASALLCVFASLVLLAGVPRASAQQTFHVQLGYGTDSSNCASATIQPAPPCGIYTDTSSNNPGDVNSNNPASVHILKGDSVAFDWTTQGSSGGHDLHTVTQTSGFGNGIALGGGFDSGSHTTGTADPTPTGGTWTATDTFTIGPGTLTTGSTSTTRFFECFVHLFPMYGAITVDPFGSATHFAVSPSTGTPTAGAQFTVTITALDRNNNVVTNYGNALSFSSSDGTAVFSLNMNWSNGALIENVTLNKSQNQSITASNGSGGGTGNVTVQPAALDHFVIDAPASTKVGANTNFTVTAFDVFNNVKTNYAGTVHFSSSDGTATLPADATLTNGGGTFGVTFNTAGSPTLGVNDSVAPSIQTMVTITVNPASCAVSDQTFNNGPAAISFAGQICLFGFCSGPPTTTPYPSGIPVTLAAGQVVGKVTVTVNGLTENTNSGDVELLLSGPHGQEVVLMSGAGSGVLGTGIDLTFDDGALNSLPQSSALFTGTFRPTAYNTPNFAAIGGGPAGPYPEPATQGNATLESQFAGTDANGTWNLYVLDAGVGFPSAPSGGITGWSLDITPAYASPASAAVSLSTTGFGGTATTTPYPSTITVAGLQGNIAGMSLILNGLTINDCSATVAYLLQGPGGQFLIPMSLVGPCFTATSANVTISDTAASAAPKFPNALPSGVYRPASYILTQSGFGEQPAFASPAPAGPYSSPNLPANDGTATLSSVFKNTDPNGPWKLFAVYQPQIPGAPADTASITSWSLLFELQCATCNASVVASTGSSSSFNQPVVFTATISSNFEQPGGTVTFCDGSASNGTCTGTALGTGVLDGSGHATFTTSALAVGGHSITANFPGDSTYPTATSAPLAFTVSKDSTQTSLGSSLNPSTFSQSVKFTANVAPGPFGGSPTGTVTFKDGATTLGSSALSAGTATFTTSALTASASPHSITAVYGGNGSFLTSTSTVLTQTVNKAASATALVSSLNPSTYGTNVTFTATVTSTAGTPTGTVTFKDGATVLGTPTLTAGVATFSTSALSVGSHSITANYNGAGDYNTSVSTTLTQTVNKQSTTTSTLTSKPSGAFYGQSITFTASVSASPTGPSAPTGTVTFKDNGVALATAALNSGTASLTCAPAHICSAFNAGSHPITAKYSGDGNYTASTTSSTITQIVNKTPTTSAVTSSLNPSSFGQSVTFTATITSAVNGVFPDGSVTICDGAISAGACTGTILGTPTLDASGVATVTTAALTAGSHTLNVLYSGSSNFNLSDSTGAPLTQTVNRAATTTTLAVQETPSYLPATQDLFRHPITLTATLTSSAGTPAGSVIFKDNGVVIGSKALVSGKATLTVVLGTIGKHILGAFYNTTANFNASNTTIIEYRSPKGH